MFNDYAGAAHRSRLSRWQSATSFSLRNNGIVRERGEVCAEVTASSCNFLSKRTINESIAVNVLRRVPAIHTVSTTICPAVL